MTEFDGSGIVRQLKKEHERLTRQIHGIAAAISAFSAVYGKRQGTRGTVSAGVKAKLGSAQKTSRAKAGGSPRKASGASTPKKRTISAAGRKRIAAAQKLRWAKIRAQKKAG